MLLSWLGLLAIWLLFELPSALHSARPDLSAVRFSLEVPLLVTLWGLNEGTGARRTVRIMLRIAAITLVVLRVDAWICLLLMHEEPLLYDQWFMARHLGVLISDLVSWRTLLVLVGVALAGWLLTRTTHALLARARVLLEPARRAWTLKVALGIWAALIAVQLRMRDQVDPSVRWWTPALLDNVAQSRAVYQGVQRQLKRSTYSAYDPLRLGERPDVLLFIVESYGRLLSIEPETSEAHAALLAELSGELGQAGWHAVSAFSTAPVSGARSWIAEGTMLMGTPIRYEAVFQHIISQRPRNLVGFFNLQDYETVLLAPADRNRPGAQVVNRYGFTRVITYEQLGYRGPPVGWGLVPDQYSLAVVEQRVLQNPNRPVFLDFHMVTSHAPWRDVPELTPEAQVPTADSTSLTSIPVKQPSPTTVALRPLRRYDRRPDARDAYMVQFDNRMRAGYQATITYDLRLIAQYLARRSDDALVLVIGDHQPPVIARSDPSYDTPLHILSRSPARLSELRRHGFVEGLALSPSAPAAVTHAGLFSLLVRTLCAAGCTGGAMPQVLPQGDVLLGR